MADAELPSFTLVVEEVFSFAGGTTVFVGTGDALPRSLAPCDAELRVDGNTVRLVRLTAERMPGQSGKRVVETSDRIDTAALRGHRCELVHSV